MADPIMVTDPSKAAQRAAAIERSQGGSHRREDGNQWVEQRLPDPAPAEPETNRKPGQP